MALFEKYPDDTKISNVLTAQDIETFEKVLGVCAQWKSIKFTKEDALDITSQTSNILRWMLDMPIRDLFAAKRTLCVGVGERR